MMSSEAATFLKELQSEVLHRSTGGDGSPPDFKENVFTEYVMDLLAGEVGIVENPEAVHFQGEINRGHAKINGYALPDDGQDQDALDLFVSVYKGFEEPQRVPAEEMRKAAEQAIRYLVGALGDLHTKLDPAQVRYGMAQRINAAGKHLKRARLFILTDGVTDLAREKPKLVPVKGSDIELRIEFWDIERLSRVVAYGRPQEEIDIDIAALHGQPLSCVASRADQDEYSAYVTIIPGTLLYKIYDEHGPRLLERNVRSFLQAKGKVNRGIRDTLKQQPGRFLAYNNGISMTAESVETAATSDGSLGIARIRGLQIVNGGQTTASIYRAADGSDGVNLSHVFIQAKLTVVRNELADTLAPKIAEYANTQNPIQMADFSANDPFHIEIERLSKRIWTPDQQGQWFYERARGQYFVELAREGDTQAKARRFKEKYPQHRKFDKLEIAKVINAWDQLPYQVCLGGQKNFVQFTQRIRETKAKSWKPDEAYFKELVAKKILFTESTRIVGKRDFSDLRSQIVAYTISALSFRTGGQFDLMYVWNSQRLSTQLEDMLKAWARQISEAIPESALARGLKNFGEWCKKPDCWKAIQRLDLNFPETMPPELQKIERTGGRWGVAPTETRAALDPDDLDAYRQCRQLDAADWIRIIKWGSETGLLDQRQQKVAADIGAAAAGGWTKDLDPKRAREGRTIINLAIEHGGLDQTAAT
jgi:hypothetical protein